MSRVTCPQCKRAGREGVVPQVSTLTCPCGFAGPLSVFLSPGAPESLPTLAPPTPPARKAPPIKLVTAQPIELVEPEPPAPLVSSGLELLPLEEEEHEEEPVFEDREPAPRKTKAVGHTPPSDLQAAWGALPVPAQAAIVGVPALLVVVALAAALLGGGDGSQVAGGDPEDREPGAEASEDPESGADPDPEPGGATSTPAGDPVAKPPPPEPEPDLPSLELEGDRWPTLGTSDGELRGFHDAVVGEWATYRPESKHVKGKVVSWTDDGYRLRYEIVSLEAGRGRARVKVNKQSEADDKLEKKTGRRSELFVTLPIRGSLRELLFAERDVLGFYVDPEDGKHTNWQEATNSAIAACPAGSFSGSGVSVRLQSGAAYNLGMRGHGWFRAGRELPGLWARKMNKRSYFGFQEERSPTIPVMGRVSLTYGNPQKRLVLVEYGVGAASMATEDLDAEGLVKTSDVRRKERLLARARGIRVRLRGVKKAKDLLDVERQAQEVEADPEANDEVRRLVAHGRKGLENLRKNFISDLEDTARREAARKRYPQALQALDDLASLLKGEGLSSELQELRRQCAQPKPDETPPLVPVPDAAAAPAQERDPKLVAQVEAGVRKRAKAWFKARGSKRLFCKKCKGEKKVDCSACRGKTVVNCKDCGGKGWTKSNRGGRLGGGSTHTSKSDCRACSFPSGTKNYGKVRCRKCSRGKASCEGCVSEGGRSLPTGYRALSTRRAFWEYVTKSTQGGYEKKGFFDNAILTRRVLRDAIGAAPAVKKARIAEVKVNDDHVLVTATVTYVLLQGARELPETTATSKWIRLNRRYYLASRADTNPEPLFPE